MTNAPNQVVSLQRDQAGEFVLPAEMLAERFGWPSHVLHDYMRRGLVVSRVEQGHDQDLGRWRLSVRCGNRQWQAVVDDDGTLSNERFETLRHSVQRS